MPSSPTDTFAVIVALTDKLVANQPRNLDLAHLRFLLNVLTAEPPKPPRKRDWAAIKRRQRARRGAGEDHRGV
jgi:hypothetical protein